MRASLLITIPTHVFISSFFSGVNIPFFLTHVTILIFLSRLDIESRILNLNDRNLFLSS